MPSFSIEHQLSLKASWRCVDLPHAASPDLHSSAHLLDFLQGPTGRKFEHVCIGSTTLSVTCCSHKLGWSIIRKGLVFVVRKVFSAF